MTLQWSLHCALLDVVVVLHAVNTLASGCFSRFLRKSTETHVALRGNFSGPVSATDLVKRFFGWEVADFL